MTHERFRCTKKLCRAYSYYNYVVAHNRKSNSIRPVDAKYIFVTANTGFCVQFLNYHEALQFCGSLSDMAVSWAQATTMWDSQMDMQTERSWRERYAEARLLWNVMQEMVEMTGNKPDATKTLYSINIASRLVKHVVSWDLHSNQLPKNVYDHTSVHAFFFCQFLLSYMSLVPKTTHSVTNSFATTLRGGSSMSWSRLRGRKSWKLSWMAMRKLPPNVDQTCQRRMVAFGNLVQSGITTMRLVHGHESGRW